MTNEEITLCKAIAPYVDPGFIAVMNDIGRYGNDKYGPESFHQKAKRGDFTRGTNPRAQSAEIIRHSQVHGDLYLRGEIHDHFGTLEHQLGAQAFNPMMEYYFLSLESR